MSREREAYEFLIVQSARMIWRGTPSEITPEEWFFLCLDLLNSRSLPELLGSNLVRRSYMMKERYPHVAITDLDLVAA